jgi:hypothetical protein
MLDQRAWDQIADAVGLDDFYRADHRLIFEAIGTLTERDQPPDAVTVSEHLERQSRLEAAGGLDYIAQLVEDTPSAANIRAYARIVRDHSMLRQLIEIGGDIAASAHDNEGRTVTELVDLAEQRVFEIADRGRLPRQRPIHAPAASPPPAACWPVAARSRTSSPNSSATRSARPAAEIVAHGRPVSRQWGCGPDRIFDTQLPVGSA